MTGKNSIALAICLQVLMTFVKSSSAEFCGNATLEECLNGGECSDEEVCVCQAGYSGLSCENKVLSVSILVIVCIMPLVTWTIVCCYGCKSLQAKARRRDRQRARAGRDSQEVQDDGVPEHDEPPGYYQAVYSNPFTISGDGDQLDWTSRPDDYLELPPHYDDLAITIAIKSSPSARPSTAIISTEGGTEATSRSGGDSGTLSSSPNCLTFGDPSPASEIPGRSTSDVEIQVDDPTTSSSTPESLVDHQASLSVLPEEALAASEPVTSGTDRRTSVEVDGDDTAGRSSSNQEYSGDEPSEAATPDEMTPSSVTDIEMTGEGQESSCGAVSSPELLEETSLGSETHVGIGVEYRPGIFAV